MYTSEEAASPSQEDVMFPEIKPLAEPMESVNSFLTVLFRSVVTREAKYIFAVVYQSVFVERFLLNSISSKGE